MNKNFDSKYANVLTVILVIVIIAILGLGGYLAFNAILGEKRDGDAQNVANEFDKKVPTRNNTTNTADNNNININDILNEINIDVPIDEDTSSQSSQKVYYEGYEVVGTIRIPKTGIKYPILPEPTTHALEVAVAMLYGVGLNQPGNTTIIGHNLRNGKFFSNNKRLSEGDSIYIKDATGLEIEYIIYDMYETDPSDAEYMLRDTQGAREISLSTCTDDSSARLIILAKEK